MTSKPTRVILNLIGCPIHSALCHIETKSFVNYYIYIYIYTNIRRGPVAKWLTCWTATNGPFITSCLYWRECVNAESIIGEKTMNYQREGIRIWNEEYFGGCHAVNEIWTALNIEISVPKLNEHWWLSDLWIR